MLFDVTLYHSLRYVRVPTVQHHLQSKHYILQSILQSITIVSDMFESPLCNDVPRSAHVFLWDEAEAEGEHVGHH